MKTIISLYLSLSLALQPILFVRVQRLSRFQFEMPCIQNMVETTSRLVLKSSEVFGCLGKCSEMIENDQMTFGQFWKGVENKSKMFLLVVNSGSLNVHHIVTVSVQTAAERMAI